MEAGVIMVLLIQTQLLITNLRVALEHLLVTHLVIQVLKHMHTVYHLVVPIVEDSQLLRDHARHGQLGELHARSPAPPRCSVLPRPLPCPCSAPGHQHAHCKIICITSI